MLCQSGLFLHAPLPSYHQNSDTIMPIIYYWIKKTFKKTSNLSEMKKLAFRAVQDTEAAFEIATLARGH